MTAPWRQQDGGLGADIGSLGREVCVPMSSRSPFPGLPWDGCSKGHRWACEAGPGVV